MNPLSWIDGYKVYLAAGGFALLGLYYLSENQYDLAMQNFTAALGAWGLRHAIAKQTDAVVKNMSMK